MSHWPYVSVQAVVNADGQIDENCQILNPLLLHKASFVFIIFYTYVAYLLNTLLMLYLVK